jgi:hypothetical protein
MQMPNKPYVLSSKIKITADPDKPESPPHKHVGFYMHYSFFVFKSLQKRSFQRFLHKMLKTENIREQSITEVLVKVFPQRRNNGNGLAGNCAPARGKIQIYPKTMTFCRAFKQKFGKSTFFAYACSRARAALIHELLHLKYAANEKRVRELARKYFFNFTRKTLAQNRLSFVSYTMIFTVAHSKPFSFLKTYRPPTQPARL